VTVRLAGPESRALESYCRRQLRWDATLPVRVVTSANAIGMFTVPPFGVLAFAAVPLVAPTTDVIDRTVRLSDWANLLSQVDASAVGGTVIDPTELAEVVPPVVSGPSLRSLPPSDNWQVPMYALSGDLVPSVQAAVKEFEQATAGLGERAQQTVADEIWDRPAWAALPMRVLHAARQLGMLTEDRARVSASTSGSWKRLSTPRGQVFVPASGPAARLSLRIVR